MSRPPPPSARISLDNIRGRIGLIPMPEAGIETPLVSAVHQLSHQSDSIIDDDALLDEVLLLDKQLAAYRGKGAQSAVLSLSNLFEGLAFELVSRVSITNKRFPSFAAAQQEEPTHMAAWAGMEKIASRSLDCIQTPRPKSQLASRLKSAAWSHLGCISAVVCQPAWIELALTLASDNKVPPPEREAAISFLTEAWNETLDESAEARLLKLQVDAPSRSFLFGVMSLLVDLNLSNDFAAMSALDDWDDAHDEEE